MKIRRLFTLPATITVMVASLALAPGVAAAPNPDNNPNAAWVTFSCDGHDVTIASIVQNQATTIQVVDGSGKTITMVSLYSWSDAAHTQDETLWFTVPGYDHNGRATTTCDFPNPQYPDLYWEATVFVSPPQ